MQSGFAPSADHIDRKAPLANGRRDTTNTAAMAGNPPRRDMQGNLAVPHVAAGPGSGAVKNARVVLYRAGAAARHWVKAASLVRIIFHPSASRLAIFAPLSAVIPHATL